MFNSQTGIPAPPHFRESDWYDISRFQKLLEPFLREFKEKVYWPRVGECQKLTKEFRKEFHNEIIAEAVLIERKYFLGFLQETNPKEYQRYLQNPSIPTGATMVSPFFIN